MQNSLYAEALEQGRAASSATVNTFDGVMAVILPVVECNRKQVDNGRTYLREMVFGDPTEPHHRAALSLTSQTEELMAAVITRDGQITPTDARALARIAAAVMFISLAATVNASRTTDEIVNEIRAQVRVVLPDTL